MDFSQFQTTAATNPVPIVARSEGQGVFDWPSTSITYVVSFTTDLRKAKRNLSTVLPYVDRAIVLANGSPESIRDYLADLDKVETVVGRWDSPHDVLGEQLKHARGGWLLIMNEDSLPSHSILSNLGGLITASNDGEVFSTVEFTKINVISGNHVPIEEEYHKLLLKCYPGIGYQQGKLSGVRGPIARCDHSFYSLLE